MADGGLHKEEAARIRAAVAADARAARGEFLFRPPPPLDGALRALLADPRDAPILYLALNILCTTVPAALALLWLRPASNLPGLAYLVANYALYLQRFMLMLHFSEHRRLFRKGGCGGEAGAGRREGGGRRGWRAAGGGAASAEGSCHVPSWCQDGGGSRALNIPAAVPLLQAYRQSPPLTRPPAAAAAGLPALPALRRLRRAQRRGAAAALPLLWGALWDVPPPPLHHAPHGGEGRQAGRGNGPGERPRLLWQQVLRLQMPFCPEGDACSASDAPHAPGPNRELPACGPAGWLPCCPQEDNKAGWDLSSTEPFQRDNFLHFLGWVGRGKLGPAHGWLAGWLADWEVLCRQRGVCASFGQERRGKPAARTTCQWLLCGGAGEEKNLRVLLPCTPLRPPAPPAAPPPPCTATGCGTGSSPGWSCPTMPSGGGAGARWRRAWPPSAGTWRACVRCGR